MSLLENSNPKTVEPEYCDIAETQVKDIKITFINIVWFLKEGKNESLRDIYENTNK